MIRLGIIGCGRVAEERHLPPLLRMPEVRVVATADPDAARSARLADRLGAPLRLSDYRAVLDRSDVDAVAILTPTQSHAEIGIAALDAGKHVLVEKPLALSLAECDRFIASAARSPCKVVVGFNLRWHRLVRRAREFLDTGALGRVKAIRSAYTHDRSGETAPAWHRRLELGGGVVFNESVHHFDLWRLFAGCEVEQVFSISIPSAWYEDETNAIAARMAGGVLATGIFTFRTGPTSEVEIYGENGRLCLSLYRFDGLEFFPTSMYPGDLGHRLMRTVAALGSLPRAVAVARRGGDFQATFDGLWRHFIDCILHDLPSQCTLEDGRNGLCVALAAIQSACSGLPVQVRTTGA
jgi:predicted dehydrogenase